MEHGDQLPSGAANAVTVELDKLGCWAVEGDRGASAGPAAGRAGWLHAAGDGGGSNNGLGAGWPGRRMTVGEGLKLFWGREGVEGLTGAAEMMANGEKVKLAGDMDGGERKMGPEGLNV